MPTLVGAGVVAAAPGADLPQVAVASGDEVLVLLVGAQHQRGHPGAMRLLLLPTAAGFDYRAMTIDPDPVAQARQCFANIRAALAEAGAALDDVVRVRYYAPERADFEKLAPVLGENFAAVRPAATALFCGLADPRMKIEIEVTARKRRS